MSIQIHKLSSGLAMVQYVSYVDVYNRDMLRVAGAALICR